VERALKLVGMGPRAARGTRVQGEVAEHTGKLGIEICDIAAEIEEVAARTKRQRALCDELRHATDETLAGNRQIAEATRHALTVADEANADVAGSRETVSSSLEAIHDLVDGVARVESEI